jgi:anti-sigma regulatory factor (Ser/Thr protein kinase)
MESTAARICLPAQSQCLERIRAFAREILKSHTRDRRLRRNLVLAIDEAAANVIEHAYPKSANLTSPIIDLSIEFGRDRIVIQIIDQGIPFKSKFAGKPLPGCQEEKNCPENKVQDEGMEENANTITGKFRSISQQRRRGFGLRLIRHIVDEVEYRRTPFGENLLIMTKRLKKTPLA